MKKVLIIIAVLVVLLIAAIAGVFMFALSQADNIAKQVVERGGSYAMGVATTVDQVDVELFKGTATMSGLNIANPTGFNTDHFFALASSDAQITLESINTNTVIIPKIHLSGINVILDKGKKPSNYNQILHNLSRFESGDAKPADATKQGKNVIINSLVLEDISIHVANMPGVSLLAGDVAVKIPRIELQNVGEKGNMKAADIFNLVIKTVLAAAVEAGGGIIPGDVLGELTNGLGSLSSLSDLGINAISDLNLDEVMGGVEEQVNKAVEDLGKQTEDIKKTVDDATKDVEKKIDDAANEIKGIFGGKKKDSP